MSGNLSLIAPFPDLCLLVPFYVLPVNCSDDFDSSKVNMHSCYGNLCNLALLPELLGMVFIPVLNNLPSSVVSSKTIEVNHRPKGMRFSMPLIYIL